MLSDAKALRDYVAVAKTRLNAPFGARCFLTNLVQIVLTIPLGVLMRLLALGAF